MSRFGRIRREFGVGTFVRTALLLGGLLAMPPFDYFAFGSYRAGVISAAGLVLGFLLRKRIPDGIEHYPPIVKVGLFIYPIILFVGERLGLGRSAQLAFITAVTAAIFDLQFWSLSDPSVVKGESSEFS
jgi:hypothetical protein